MFFKSAWEFLTKGFYLGRQGVEVKKISNNRLGLRILGALVVGLALLILILKLFENRLVFFPDKGAPLTPEATGWAFEDLYLESEGGAMINAWHLPGPSPDSQTVLLFHGNGGSMENMLGRVMTWHKLEYGVMAVDYQGFGLSEGSPTEKGTYADAEAAWKYLTEDAGVRPENIIIYGFSLGGGVAVYLAEAKKEHKNILVLDSTFTRLSDVPSRVSPALGLPARLILGDAYDSLARIKNVSPSLLLSFHSPQDEVVPYALGRELFDAYTGGPKEFYELSGLHMEYTLNQGVYSDAIYKKISQMRPLALTPPDDGAPLEKAPERVRGLLGGGQGAPAPDSGPAPNPYTFPDSGTAPGADSGSAPGQDPAPGP
jgi:pimeloyl-ACP methyl ester carboxylesterase